MDQNMTPHDALDGIHCDVTNCHYNDHKACCAKQIKVGPQYASTSADTVCATFRPSQKKA